MVGPEGARLLQGMIQQASQPTSGVVATVASLATMFFGASGVVGQLQGSLNQIWNTPPPDPGTSAVRSALRRRALAFAMIIVVGILLLASLTTSAALSALHEIVDEQAPLLGRLVPPLNLGFSFLVITALFAMIYKLLPDVAPEWRDVWIGALVTAILFSVGKSLIGLYLGRAGVASVYGAAGSLVLVLLWIYYSAQLLFIGAEFTEVYSRFYGSRREALPLVPAEDEVAAS
jgi:membrane protein